MKECIQCKTTQTSRWWGGPTCNTCALRNKRRSKGIKERNKFFDKVKYKAEWHKRNYIKKPKRPRFSNLTPEQLELKRALRKEKEKRYKALWNSLNKERKKELARKYARTEKYKTLKKQYRKNNKHKINAITAKRRAIKKNAYPKWLTKKQKQQIVQYYKQAQILTQDTGIQHHVDHIVPLVSDFVCGLHVPWNLQVIPAIDNFQKSNKIAHLNYETA